MNEKTKLDKRLFYGYADAFFYSLMVGAGEAFFVAYALYLNYSQLESSILITVPIVLGGVFQLISPYGINKFKSYKSWTVLGVLIQSIIFLVLVLLKNQIANSFLLFFSLVTLYWSLALGITPSWNTWISSILKENEIRQFFSTRTVILAVGTLMGLLFSGLLLQYAPNEILGMAKYDFIFICCFFFRFASLITLTKHPRVKFKELSESISGALPNNKFIKKFIIFSSLFKLGVYFSASFFSPYMLKQLQFSYLEFTAVLISAFLGRAIISNFSRKLLAKMDINLVYFFAALGITSIPFFWVFIKNVHYIFLLEIMTGILWGAFELSFTITCFEEIPTDKQAKIMSQYNILHTLCIGIGSFAGLYLFSTMPENAQTYHLIFIGSVLLRFSSLLFFPRKTIDSSQNIVYVAFNRTLGIRPNMGSIGRPVWQILKKIKKPKD